MTESWDGDPHKPLEFYKPISRDALKAIIQFIPELEEVDAVQIFAHRLGELLESESLTFRLHGEYHPLVGRLLDALYQHGFVQSYDWPKFTARAEELYKHPRELSRVTLRTCVKLLTLHARRERFSDGHFPSMLAEGHLLAILRRIAEVATSISI
jgi:Family of unknown function (DUF6508)